MPAISFQEEWINHLLRCNKQQTTRAQTSRIKVGDVCKIYNQQRKKIIDKPLRSLTDIGYGKMAQLSHRGQMNYPAVPFTNPARQYPTHFIGKVEITEVYDIHPHLMSDRPLEEWARADGFPDFATARCWFEIRYGARWMHKAWTVIRWNGWVERYFEPEE